MILSPFGFREWFTISVIAAIGIALAVWLQWTWALITIAIIWFALVLFFRDPVRKAPTDLSPDDFLSPADGTISGIERVDHHLATDGHAIVIRIFLSVLNVHINRASNSGTVKSIRYTPGKFHDARSSISARENESNLITLCTKVGETFGIKQISGAIARRIVCATTVGKTLSRGQRFGMIKFGSTTELILPRPDDVIIHVNVGDPVRAGQTILATLPPTIQDTPRTACQIEQIEAGAL